jgi:hypothetical protein
VRIERSAGTSRFSTALAPAASLLCLIHCVGTAVLASVLPSAAVVLEGAPALEWSLWLLSGASSAWAHTRSGPKRWAVMTATWAASAIAGGAALLGEHEAGLRLSLAGFLVVSLEGAWRRLRRHRRCAAPGASDDCCPP